MGYREEYEAEIDLKDMLFYVLRRWRSILLAGLVVCILFSAYKVVRRAGIAPENLIPQKVKDYEYEMAVYELDRAAYERDIENYTELLKHQREYMEKSVLMQTDPYRKPTATADVFVKLDNAEWEGLPANIGLDPTDTVLKAYTSNFSATLDWEPIETLTGSERIYLEEMLSMSVDYNSNTFTVKVVYPEGEIAQGIMDIVLEQIMDRQQEVAEEVGRHTITVSNSSFTYTLDSSLAEKRRSNEAMLANYERSLLELRTKLEELEEPDKPVVIGFVKYPAAGFVLGIFLMAFFYGAAYLLDGKLHGEGSLRDRYGYALLGVLPRSQQKRILSKIDQFLNKLAGMTTESEEEACRRVALNITKLAEGQDKILLTGTVPFGKLQALAEAVSKQLGGTILIPAADISLHAEALETLAGCSAVLLAEEEGKSHLFRIRKQCECITALDKPVVGYVLL